LLIWVACHKSKQYAIRHLAFLSKLLGVYSRCCLGRLACSGCAFGRRVLVVFSTIVLAKTVLIRRYLVAYANIFSPRLSLLSKLRLFDFRAFCRCFWLRPGIVFWFNHTYQMEHRAVLEADSIELAFRDRKILQNIYLKISQNQITALLGRNGGGKSCLLQIIFGTLTPTHKSVRWNGQYVESPYQKLGLVRYLPQHPLTPSSMSVEKAFEWYGINPDIINYEKMSLLKDQRMGQLSGGERRFLETLMILLSPVQFVFLDEPFSHLSPIYVEHLKIIIQAQKSQKGILITDHLYRDVLDIADQTYLLQNGTTYLLSNPRQELIDRGYIPE
jgi:lipopolysaccharide export system ATP-binding protein